jgi:baseplate upper protein BppU
MAIKNPNHDTFSRDCTIDDATLGQFSCVLDNASYQLIGDYSAEVSIFKGTEIDTSFPFSYQVDESIPLS